LKEWSISKGRANGTLCRVIGVKRKSDQPLKWRNYDGKKVYPMNVSDTEFAEFEHFSKKLEQINLENQIAILQEQLKQDPLSSKISNEMKNI
jgi:bifunctional pyridoxal-dependent enzyme with beta-cystathionase and maltose regulon repressor activities